MVVAQNCWLQRLESLVYEKKCWVILSHGQIIWEATGAQNVKNQTMWLSIVRAGSNSNCVVWTHLRYCPPTACSWHPTAARLPPAAAAGIGEMEKRARQIKVIVFQGLGFASMDLDDFVYILLHMVRAKGPSPAPGILVFPVDSAKLHCSGHGPPYLVLLGLGCGWPCRQGARASKETSAVHDCQRNSYDMEQLRVLQMWRLMRGAKGILVHLQHWSVVRMPDMPWHQCDCKPTRKWRQQSTAWRWTEWSKDQCAGGRTKPSEFYARKRGHLGQRIYSRYQPPLLPLVKKYCSAQ